MVCVCADPQWVVHDRPLQFGQFLLGPPELEVHGTGFGMFLVFSQQTQTIQATGIVRHFIRFVKDLNPSKASSLRFFQAPLTSHPLRVCNYAPWSSHGAPLPLGFF